MTDTISKEKRDIDGGWAWVVLGGCLYVSVSENETNSAIF